MSVSTNRPVNKPTTQTPAMIQETIRLKEALIRHYDNRIIEHPKTADKLVVAVTAAEQALQREFDEVREIPGKLNVIHQEIAILKMQLAALAVKPQLNKFEKMKARMLEMTASLTPEEREELSRLVQAEQA